MKWTGVKLFKLSWLGHSKKEKNQKISEGEAVGGENEEVRQDVGVGATSQQNSSHEMPEKDITENVDSGTTNRSEEIEGPPPPMPVITVAAVVTVPHSPLPVVSPPAVPVAVSTSAVVQHVSNLTDTSAMPDTNPATIPIVNKSTQTGALPPSKKALNVTTKNKTVLQVFQELGIHNGFLNFRNGFFNSSKYLVSSLPPDDPTFIDIQTYVNRGHEDRIVRSRFKIHTVFRIFPRDESPTSMPSSSTSNRMLLWHGTRRPCVRSILKNGFRLPNDHGQGFGAGIYFADAIRKSYRYCDHGGYLFLCDVQLGKMYCTCDLLQGITEPPEAGHDSVKAVGRMTPDCKGDKLIDGCKWPLGGFVHNSSHTAGYWHHDQYIVYKSNQVTPKFLVKIERT